METLEDRCPKAAASLREGLEETLMLHKLGVAKVLRDRLRTTNIIESINGGLAHTTRRVIRWCNSNQRQRWIAAACLDIEENSHCHSTGLAVGGTAPSTKTTQSNPKTLSHTPKSFINSN